MPPQRTTPMSQKPLKTERTHEENQERYAFHVRFMSDHYSHAHLVPTSLLLDEVTEVLKPEWNLRAERRKSTSVAPADHYE